MPEATLGNDSIEYKAKYLGCTVYRSKLPTVLPDFRIMSGFQRSFFRRLIISQMEYFNSFDLGVNFRFVHHFTTSLLGGEGIKMLANVHAVYR